MKLQAEYLGRRESGQLNFDTAKLNLADSYRGQPSGGYLQGVYQFLPRWRFGVRYDALHSGSPQIGLIEHGLVPANALAALLPASPSRVSVMFDWNPSEFTRLRAQYAWDDARTSLRDRQLMLQYLYSIGAHGAHQF